MGGRERGVLGLTAGRNHGKGALEEVPPKKEELLLG